jgi:hypothetical protein
MPNAMVGPLVPPLVAAKRTRSGWPDRLAATRMATVEIVPTSANARLHQWLVIVALAAGLIGMHHLVVMGAIASHGGAHQGAMAATTTLPDAAAPHAELVTGRIASTGRDGSIGSPDTVTTENEVAASAGRSVSAAGCCPEMGCMMGHPCVTILTAAGAMIAPAMLNTVATHSQAVLLPLTYGVDSLLARAPPSSDARLSLLGVWRR